MTRLDPGHVLTSWGQSPLSSSCSLHGLTCKWTHLHSCPVSTALCNGRPLIKGKGERRGYLSPVQLLPHLHWSWFYQLEILLGQKDLKLASYFKLELIKYAKVYFCATMRVIYPPQREGTHEWLQSLEATMAGRRFFFKLDTVTQ